MKQKPVDGYRPNYPKKLIKGAALTAAAMLTLSPALACRTAPQISGDIMIDEPTEEPELSGVVAIDEPTPDPETTCAPELMGEIAIDEPTPDPEEPEWMGDVIADPSEP